MRELVRVWPSAGSSQGFQIGRDICTGKKHSALLQRCLRVAWRGSATNQKEKVFRHKQAARLGLLDFP